LSESTTHATSEQWSKDYFEHLRAVHFSLVVLCVGLIVLASLTPKSEMRAAHEQVLEILEVTNNWRKDLFDNEAKNVVKADSAKDDRSAFVITSTGDVVANYLLSWNTNSQSATRPKFKASGWTVALNVPAELLPEPPPEDPDSFDTVGPSFSVNGPQNLKSFQALWDDLLQPGSIMLPRRPTECFYTTLDRNVDVMLVPCAILPLNSSASVTRDDELVLEPTDSTVKKRFQRASIQSDVQFDFSSQPLAGTFFDPGRILLPVRDAKQIHFDGQNVLIQLSSKWKAKHGLSFKDAFRDLAAVDGTFEDASIESVERILDGEAKTQTETFETFGLKIPGEIAVRFGALLVLAVQLYLWIHLREVGLRMKQNTDLDIAWIGTYSSKAARILFYVTVTVLPLITLVVLGLRGLTTSDHRWFGWTALVATISLSLVLDASITMALPKVRLPR
jgi:hypothetical protein